MSVKKIDSMVKFYNFRNKTILVNTLLEKHYNDMMKWKMLDFWNTIEDNMSFKASELLKKYNHKYSYLTITKWYKTEYLIDISENTLIKLKTKNKNSNVKHKTVCNIIKLLEKIDKLTKNSEENNNKENITKKNNCASIFD